MKKTLLVMAAGLGSRYGGLKQIDGVGPDGEYLIDYSVYDAWQTGFDKVVFVIKREFAREFKRHFAGSKFKGKIKVDYAYQDLDDLPHDYKVPVGRTKPWGTGHAILAGRNFIKEPFAVISADDFYGHDAFAQMSDFLGHLPRGSQQQYGLIGYRLAHTLSPNGWVARGLCKVDKDNNLTSIFEHTKIGLVKGKIVSRDKNEVDHVLNPERLVSMVMFGFTPDFFNYLAADFKEFLAEHGQSLTQEFFTPNVVNHLVQDSTVGMKVLPTQSHWFGMTYLPDKKAAVKEIKALIKSGEYPAILWEKLYQVTDFLCYASLVKPHCTPQYSSACQVRVP